MEEEEVDAKPRIVDTQSALPTKERKVVSQFQEEVGKVADESVFQIGFGVFVFEAEKFENEWVFDRLFHRPGISRCSDLRFLQ